MSNQLKLTFFGTAAGFPTKKRPNTTAIGLWCGGSLYLFDAGDGTAAQFARMDIPPDALRAIFLTHLHADHVGGLPGLIQWLQLNKRSAPLPVYVPDASLEDLKRFLHLVYLYPAVDFELSLEPVGTGFSYQESGLEVAAVPSHHLEPGEEKRRRTGVRTEGQAFSFIVTAEGRRVYLSGDLASPKEAEWRAKDTDVAVVELAHFQPEELGEALSAAGVPRLVVTHLIDTLEPLEDGVPDRIRAAGFEGEITIARDGLELEI